MIATDPGTTVTAHRAVPGYGSTLAPPASRPLLTSKTGHPPVRSNLVPRGSLTGRLHEGLTRPLTLVAAPSGCGETTLIGEWRVPPLPPCTLTEPNGLDHNPAEGKGRESPNVVLFESTHATFVAVAG
jgi:hypothetical protein